MLTFSCPAGWPARVGGAAAASWSPSSRQLASNMARPLSSRLRRHVVVVDADLGQRAEHLLRVGVVAAHRVRGDPAVVGDRAQGGLGHGVDHARRDQVGHVAGVGVGRVLDRRRGPQRPLRAGPRGRQRGPPRRGDHRLVALVGQPGVRDRGPPAQARPPRGADLVQPRVDLGVHPGDEERGHRRDRGQVTPGLPGPLQAVEERVHHRVVAGQGEDQRDVDADPLGQARRDGRQPLPRGRDLDEQVGPVDQPPQEARLGDGRLRCRRRAAGRPRSTPARPRRPWRRRRAAGHRRPSARRRRSSPAAPPRRRPRAPAGRGPGPRTLVAAGDRLGEDGGIGGHAHHVVVGDQVGQAAVDQPLAAQVIQPDRDALADSGQPADRTWLCSFSCLSAARRPGRRTPPGCADRRAACPAWPR